MIDLSVIIVNYNNGEYLRRCLDAIFHSIDSVNFEVIVVDNNSSDNSPEVVKNEFHQVKLIVNKKNLGFSVANNIGIKSSQGKYILLLNPDTEISEGAFTKMVNFMNNNQNVGIITCKILNPDKTIQVFCCPFPTLWSIFCQATRLSEIFYKSRLFASHRFHIKENEYNTVKEVDWVTGACLLVRREVLQDVGLLDENFFLYYEEVDLCLRAKKNNWKIKYFPEVSIIHYSSISTSQNKESSIENAFKSLIYFFDKHHKIVNRLILRLIVIVAMSIHFQEFVFSKFFLKKYETRRFKMLFRILNYILGVP